MSSSLTVELDSKGPFRCGERVRGRLHVAALEKLRAEHAVVHLAWTTFGRGEVTSSESSFFRIPGFELAAEEVREFAFELVIPEGPISFVGALIGVHWEVRAELIVDWAKNPKCACEFSVVALARAGLGSGYRGALKPTDAHDSDLVISNALASPLRYWLLLIPPAAETSANLVLPVPLASSLELEAGESRRLTGTATLPENCLPSFGSKKSNNKVEWEVVVELERGGVDFREQLPLQVLP